MRYKALMGSRSNAEQWKKDMLKNPLYKNPRIGYTKTGNVYVSWERKSVSAGYTKLLKEKSVDTIMNDSKLLYAAYDRAIELNVATMDDISQIHGDGDAMAELIRDVKRKLR